MWSKVLGIDVMIISDSISCCVLIMQLQNQKYMLLLPSAAWNGTDDTLSCMLERLAGDT